MLNFTTAYDKVQTIRSEIQKVFIGQPKVVDQLLCALLANGHILLEGAPGLGKTLLIRCLAQTFSGSFMRIQFTPDLMPADITGHSMYDNRTQDFRLRKGPIFANLVLADEINRAPAKTQAALLEAMQEKQVTIEGQNLSLPNPFMVLATQNPIEQEGTYALPQAQLDRFLLKTLIDYPSETEEIEMVTQNSQRQDLKDPMGINQIQPVTHAEEIFALQHFCQNEILVDEEVLKYAVTIIRASREWPGIALGSGPRGAIALVKAAKSMALVKGNDHVTPSDIKEIATAVLRHRITLSPDAEIEGLTEDQIIENLLQQIQAPRQ